MGLDMYLTKKTYVKNWDHMKPEERTKVTVKRNGKALPGIDPKRVSYIEEEVCYWRKANAIHKWFVDHCANGVDDCKEVYVDREQIQELVSLCEKVLATAIVGDGQVVNGYTSSKGGGWTPILEPGKVVVNAEEVAALLPTQGGFFFGGTDYNEYYIEAVKYTVEKLKPLLAELEDASGTLYYEASW